MPLEQIANIAEVFGLLIVAITLIFLTIQMRQNTKALRSTTAHAVHEQTSNLYRALSLDESLADLWHRGMQDPSSLTPAETVRFISYWHASILPVQNWFYQWRKRALDEEFWESWARVVTDVNQTPGFAYFWEQRKRYYSDEFRHFMETELFSKTPSPDYRPLGAPVGE